jgi:hypothetical protein
MALLHCRHQLDHGGNRVRLRGGPRLSFPGECLSQLGHGILQELFRFRQLLVCTGSSGVECLKLLFEVCDLVLDFGAFFVHRVHPLLLIGHLLLGPLDFLFKWLAIPPGLELTFCFCIGLGFGLSRFEHFRVVLTQ